MITKLKVSNYKSIGMLGINIDVKPLTVLLGANGTGKSSVLEAICIITQSKNKSLLASLQKGELVQYSNVESLGHKGESKREIVIEIHVGLNKNELASILEKEDFIDMSSWSPIITKQGSIGYRHSYIPDTQEVRQSIVVGGEEKIRIGYIKTGDSSYQNVIEFPRVENPLISRDVQPILVKGMFLQQHSDEIYARVARLAETAREIIGSKLLDKVFLISAFRGDVKLEGKATAKPNWVGKQGQNLIEMLSLIWGNRRYKEIREKISGWAEKFEIHGLNAGWRGDSVLGVDFTDSTFNTPLILALAGYGSRQVLSIITQLFCSQSGDIIMVEEPEISLHPNAQALLPELFADAINEGKQVIITTHSETMPLALRRPIKNGKIRARDIAVYHAKKKKKGTEFSKLVLTEDGYVRGWIPSFAEVESQLLKEWSQTIPRE